MLSGSLPGEGVLIARPLCFPMMYACVAPQKSLLTMTQKERNAGIIVHLKDVISDWALKAESSSQRRCLNLFLSTGPAMKSPTLSFTNLPLSGFGSQQRSTPELISLYEEGLGQEWAGGQLIPHMHGDWPCPVQQVTLSASRTVSELLFSLLRQNNLTQLKDCSFQSTKIGGRRASQRRNSSWQAEDSKQ